jgi:hypothetical protein
VPLDFFLSTLCPLGSVGKIVVVRDRRSSTPLYVTDFDAVSNLCQFQRFSDGKGFANFRRNAQGDLCVVVPPLILTHVNKIVGPDGCCIESLRVKLSVAIVPGTPSAVVCFHSQYPWDVRKKVWVEKPRYADARQHVRVGIKRAILTRRGTERDHGHPTPCIMSAVGEAAESWQLPEPERRRACASEVLEDSRRDKARRRLGVDYDGNEAVVGLIADQHRYNKNQGKAKSEAIRRDRVQTRTHVLRNSCLDMDVETRHLKHQAAIYGPPPTHILPAPRGPPWWKGVEGVDTDTSSGEVCDEGQDSDYISIESADDNNGVGASDEVSNAAGADSTLLHS